MFSLERAPRKESQNLVAAKMVVAVETAAVLKALPNPVERARKFHPRLTFAGDVAKGDIRKDNLTRQWKQCTGTVP